IVDKSTKGTAALNLRRVGSIL
ncbi:hypothetical protein A2U01_0110530, partial [Trifolium medium]|nr:hypothetical protein [Trifolium medium]